MQYSVFGSILTFGAMIGAITSGPIADFIGRKGVIYQITACLQFLIPCVYFWWIYIGYRVEFMQAMRVSSFVCIAGWLAIYFSEVCIILNLWKIHTPATTKMIFFLFLFLKKFEPAHCNFSCLDSINKRGLCLWILEGWQQDMEWESFHMWCLFLQLKLHPRSFEEH